MPALADALSTLDRDRAAFLAAYDALAPAQRAFRPATDAWSADDVAEHLARVDTGMLAILRRQVDAGDARRGIGRPSRIKQALVTRFMRSEGKTRMPAAVAPRVAPVGADPAATRAALAASVDAWATLVASVPPDLEPTPLWSHPVGGAYTAAQAVGFHASHFDHHVRQLARIRAAAGFPA